MPILNWIGKEKVVMHHLDVPYRILEPTYTFNTSGKSENKIIHGDNLEALKALLPEYEGRIKCIYIDPPYNTGNETWRYNDNVNDPRIKKWLEDNVGMKDNVGKEGEDFSRHDKWLCMMYPRLQLLHKLLSPDGAIFISIDDNELANLRLIMDEIFGRNNFIDYFSWQKSDTPANLSVKSKKAMEYVVAYEKSRTKQRFLGLQKTSNSDNPLIKPDNVIKELSFKKEWIITNFKKNETFKKGIFKAKKNSLELLDDISIKDGKIEQDFRMKARFVWRQENLEEEIAAGTEIRIKTKTLIPSYEKSEYKPEVPWNLINPAFGVETTQEGGDILAEIFGEKVFDFPKPPSLIEYLINFVCGKNDIILDSFAGSGTTGHAVLNLNKQDGGNRKFILVELNNYADDLTAERVKRVANGYAGKEGTGGDFTFYKLGEPLFTGDYKENLNEKIPLEKIEEYVWFTETRAPFPVKEKKKSAPFYLGRKEDTAYYFIYDEKSGASLNHAFLPLMNERPPSCVIYAESCELSKEFMLNNNIFFKKIPSDIVRF